MMHLVSYTLRPKRDATAIITALQQAGEWWHFLDDTWLIVSSETTEQLYGRIIHNFRTNDSILILQVPPDATYHGWLPKEAWDWFDQRRYR